jgi:hypothetical protein
MKFVISTAALLLLLGTSASAYALQEKGQEEQKQESKPAQKEAKPAQQQHQQSKPAQQQHQQAKPAQQQHQQSKPATHQQTTKPAQQHTQQATHTQQTHTTNHTQQTNGHSQSNTHQTRASNGNNGNNGHSDHGRITNEHYTASFGSEHRFHVNQGDYDHRRFDYGGYSFGFIDPWPMGWGYGDDVYVVYVDGGYYMYDVVHPGVRLSINIL